MQARWPLVAAFVLAATTAAANPKPTLHRLDGLVVMTPSPTQAPPPGLRLRTMVRPADRLWIGVDIPGHVPLEVGELKLDLLDPIPGGGWVATYRERFEPCYARGANVNCGTLVKIFDSKSSEKVSVLLDGYLSRPDRLEVQDVRYVADGKGGTLYFNEACQSYSKEAGGKCSSLVAFDPFASKVLWRSAPLFSNNAFLVTGQYLVAAYGFAGEPASIRVLRRSDGKVMDTQKLASTNFEMSTAGDVLSVEMYSKYGRANFRMDGFNGAAPQLVALPTTPPDPNDKPKPFDPPLVPSVAVAKPSTALPF
jgi:hypothetical protein